MALLVLLAMSTGFAVKLVHGWPIWYRWNLFLHPLLGIVASIAIYWIGRRRFFHAAKISNAWWFVPTAFGVGLAASGVVGTSVARFAAALSAVILAFAAAVIRYAKALPPGNRRPAIFGFLQTVLWTLMVFSGLSILRLSQGGGVTHLFRFHGTVAFVFVSFYLIRFLVPYARPVAAWIGLADLPRPGKMTIFSMASLGAVLGLSVVQDRVFTDPSFTLHLSTIPLEDREPEHRTMFFSDPRLTPAMMDLVDSCTKMPGCHNDLEWGFLNSNHNIAFMTPHFQKNLDALTEEIGKHNTKICMGCHTPLAFFDESLDYHDFATRNNYSCSFCHSIGEVHVSNEDRKRASYTLVPDVRHLQMFIKDGRERIPDAWTQAQIRLSPEAHARAFSKPLYQEDKFCIVCHHHQLLLPEEEGLVRPKCIECHMQPQDTMGLPGKGANHFMPGANLTVPHFAGRPEAAEVTRKWIVGDFKLDLSGWENTWEPRRKRGEPPSRATWLYMVFEATPTRPGAETTLTITTANVGMEHPFPAAALDLIEAWLEVLVTDAEGKTLLHSGAVLPDGTIEPEAHQMGGYMLGMDGQVVLKNRVWQIQKKIIHRELPTGQDTTDEYRFVVPEDAVGPLRVQARWNYRKLNQDFVTWAYGPGVAPPIVQMGQLDGDLALKPAAPAAAP